MFAKFSAEMASRLEEIVGKGNVIQGEDIGMDFRHDELPYGASHTPDAVVEAHSTEEVSRIMELCSEYELPVTVRGAGTGKVGGSVPLQGGVVLSLKGMNQLVSFDEDAQIITVQPGMLLQDVKAEAEKHGLCYPPDPGEKTATVGGNVSTNAGGPCALKYGSTKDYVADAVLVFADGSVAKLSDKEEYSSVIGSEGTLAVITQLSLKLIARPAKDVILLFPFMDTESCLNAAAKISESGFEPAVMEYLDTDLVEFSGNVTGNPVFPIEMDGERVGATLMVSLEGESDDELDEKMESIAELAEELECLDILVVDTPTLKRDTWEAHDAFHTSMEAGAKCSDELNVNLPQENISALVEFAKEQGESSGLKVLCYAHVGSGGLHIHTAYDGTKEDFIPLMASFAAQVYARCAQLSGSIVGEYGVGYAKTDYYKQSIGPEAYSRLSARKAAFDPKHILNPGKVVI